MTIKDIWVAASAIDPRLPFLVLAVVLGAVYFAWRRISPTTFHKLPDKWQSMPGVVIGALFGLGMSPSHDNVLQTLFDVLFGSSAFLVASGGHNMLKHWLPFLGTSMKEEKVKKGEVKE